MKKYLKLICFAFLVMVIFSNNVYAENFSCTSLGFYVRIDKQLAVIVRYAILIMQILVPVILIVMGTFDFVKATASQKEDEIKKGQQIFVKRLIAGALVFFVIAIVKLIISFTARGTSGSIMNCVNCFTEGPDSRNCG